MTKKEYSPLDEIYIGNKPFMKYVIATVMRLTKDNKDTATIKARGKFISRAVDIAEVTKKQLKECHNLDLTHTINIGTESFNSEDKTINVSTITINLSKQLS